MTIIFETRLSDSPYIQTITHGWTVNAGAPIRPAEIHWHMVMVKHHRNTQVFVVGPWSTAGVANYGADAEILWIKFKLGSFMPHLPTRHFLNNETTLPNAAFNRFWLKGTAWQLPDFENADTFINRLFKEEILAYDSMIHTALQGQPSNISPRTIRHRFLQATGLPQNYIRQYERARHAEALLQQGYSILDTVYEAGYFDQPHLTRALKQFIGYTPAQIIQMSQSVPEST
jgi:AraC-like DNA-binding protein